jgi:hypothetical protein
MPNVTAAPRVGLFFGKEELPRIARRTADERYRRLWKGITETSERMTQAGSLLLEGDTFTPWYYARNRLMDLSLYVLLSGKPAAAKALNGILLDLAGRDIDFWQGPPYPNRPRTLVYRGETLLAGELETAQLAMGLSIAYDWAYAFLEPETRSAVETALREKALMLLTNSARFQSERWVMNHLCVISTGLALAALVLRHTGLPVEAEIALACKGLDLWMEKIDRDGSYGESFHYWAYPVNCLFLGLFAIEKASGLELKNTHLLERSFEWALNNQVGFYSIEGFEGPVAAAVNTYDSPFLFQMEAPEVLLFTRFFKNPLAQWYGDKFLLPDPPRPDCLHTVWHVCRSIYLALDDEGLVPRTPVERALPPAAYYADTGFVYIRDSWARCGEEGGDTVFSLSSGGGGLSCSHEHYDKNSFSLFAKGEYFIVDPGHSCYRGESHRSYDTTTAAHNTLSLNGANQTLSFLEKGMLHDEAKTHTSFDNQAYIVGRNFRKDLSYIASEARRCYDPPLGQFTRRVWYVRPDYFVIWDRVDAGPADGIAAVRAVTGFNVNNYDGKTVLEGERGLLWVRRPRADLAVFFVHPADTVFDESPARLHLAYHILPDQAVEGRPGSAVRLTPRSAEGPGSGREGADVFDHVYLLCPREKGEPAPEVRVEESDRRGDAPLLEKLIFTVTSGGETSRFVFEGEKVSFDGPAGAHYWF